MNATPDPSAGHADRLRQVIDTGVALNDQLALDDLLEKVVRTAAELTGARYAALGVLDRGGARLERFIVHGLERETQERIGALPVGRGLLGALIEDARPLRLANLRDDPRSVGFPPGHPSMTSFLGVPILLRGVPYGNLYLTDKGGGGKFTAEDEELVVLLASQAAVAVENARLYESMSRWLRQLESLAEIGDAMLGDTDVRTTIRLIVSRLRELVQARLVTVMVPAEGDALVVADADGELAEVALGMILRRGASKAGRVLTRKTGERIDAIVDDPEFDQMWSRRLGMTAAIFHPLVVRDEAIGVIAVHDRLGPDPRFADADFRLVEAFAARAALAIDLGQRVARETVTRIIDAQEAERTRLARELHDETGQALTSILLGLRALEKAAGPEAVAPVRALVQEALRDVRRLAVELRPAVLDDFGLEAALDRLGDDLRTSAGLEISVSTSGLDERLSPVLETAVYRIVQEALTNAKRHADAHSIAITLRREGASVRATVDDDGKGFDGADVRDGALGLVGMRERAALLDGEVRVETRPGGGTRVVVELPVPTSPAPTRLA